MGQSGLRNRNPENAMLDEKDKKSRTSDFEKVPTPRQGSTRTARMAEEYRAEYKRVKRREQFLLGESDQYMMVALFVFVRRCDYMKDWFSVFALRNESKREIRSEE
ncbi:hypothetical protein F3K44_32165 [Bacillus megaterium]|nr:hypothetical protein [Priestia megaterium]